MPDTPLNPDGVLAATEAIYALPLGIGKVMAERYAQQAVSAYLTVAQPVVNNVEELDQLPHETVIRDSEDFVFERIVEHGKDPEWWTTTDFLNETKVTLPARVLYRPEVKP